MARSRIGSVAYWTLAIVLTVLGFVDLIAIGAPFFLTGVAMLLVGRRRSDPAVLWPALSAAWGFVLGYVALAPFGCSSAATRVAPGAPGIHEGPTICSYLFRSVSYAGGEPSLIPPLVSGVVMAVLAAWTVRWLLRRRRSTTAAVS